MKCPNCEYERQSTDVAPDYECPKCGIIYERYNPKSIAKPSLTKQHVVEVPAVHAPPATAAPDSSSCITDIPGNLAVCQTCEEIGQVRIKVPGSNMVEIALYLLMLVPGIIYAVWRRNSKTQVCGACGSEQLVAAKTRAGLAIVAAQYKDFRIVKNEVGSRYEEKPGYPVLGRGLVAFGAFFAFMGLYMTFAFEGGFAAAIFQFLWSAVFIWGGRKIMKPRKAEVGPVGQGLTGW